jgi:hypothetical protein
MFKDLECVRPDLTRLQRIAYRISGGIDPDGHADLTSSGIPLVSFWLDDVDRCVNRPRTQGKRDTRSQPAAAASHDHRIRGCTDLLDGSCNLRTEGVTPCDHLYALEGVQVAPTSFLSFHLRAVRQVRPRRDPPSWRPRRRITIRPADLIRPESSISLDWHFHGRRRSNRAPRNTRLVRVRRVLRHFPC